MWDTLICTYGCGQLCALTDGGKPEHLLPFPTSAFAASTCRGREERGGGESNQTVASHMG